MTRIRQGFAQWRWTAGALALFLAAATPGGDSAASESAVATGSFAGGDIITLGHPLARQAPALAYDPRGEPQVGPFVAVEPGLLGLLGASLAVVCMLVCFKGE